MISAVALPQTDPSAPITALPSDQTTSPVQFDVSSFKLNKDRLAEYEVLTLASNGDGFRAVGQTIRDVLHYAFTGDMDKPFGVHGQPGWVNTDRYDIEAKIAPDRVSAWQRLSNAERLLVLQRFLVDTLTLRYHNDVAPHPFYALTVAKTGLRMTEEYPGKPHPTGRTICHWIPGNSFVGESCAMEGMAAQLSHHTDLPVLDKTGLEGRYTFTIVFDRALDPRSSSTHEDAVVGLPRETATPLIDSGLKGLGLELVPSKGQINGIVIESIQAPPTN